VIVKDGAERNEMVYDVFEFGPRCMNRKSKILKIGENRRGDLCRFV